MALAGGLLAPSIGYAQEEVSSAKAKGVSPWKRTRKLGGATRGAFGAGGFAVEVAAGKRRKAFVARFDGRTLSVSHADPAASEAVSVLIPASARQEQVEYELIEIAAGEKVLVLSFGGAPAYSTVLMGALPSQQTPSLLLKGYTGVESASRVVLSVVELSTEKRLLLGRQGEEPNLCGRTVLSQTRAVDAEKARFVRVAIPALSPAERDAAKTLDVGVGQAGSRPEDRKGRVEISLAPWPTSPKPAASRLFDGTTKARALPYEAAELPVLEKVQPEALVLYPAPESEATESEQEDREAWLVSEQRAFALRLPPGRREGPYVVELPAQLRGRCLGVVQGVERWIAEVRALVQVPEWSDRSTSSLIGRLAGRRGDLAARALAAREEEMQKLIGALNDLPGGARRRSVALTSGFQPATRAAFFAELVSVGTEAERKLALSELEQLEEAGVDALSARLETARPAEEKRLAMAVGQLVPERAPELLIDRLNQSAPARRLEIRRVLAGLVRDERVFRVAQKLVGDPTQTRRSRSELVRALAPLMGELSPAAKRDVLSMLRTSGFHEAYRLTNALLELSRQDAEARLIVRRWLLRHEPEASPLERAALRRHVLTSALDRDLLAPWLAELSLPLLRSDEMRVRQAAANYLVAMPIEDAAAVLANRARQDDWPQVRERVLVALGELRRPGENAEELTGVILRALKRDEAAGVRAAAAHALDREPSKSTLKGLRKALAKDESSIVRAEAARSLGRVCDKDSIGPLTRAAHSLRYGATDEADVRLGLAAVAALARLEPPDLEERLAPLRAEGVPGILRVRIERAISPVRGQCAGDSR